ncbi:UNC5C-like protein [Diadema antillarum]|uniref:UNC5C-like protein n=1 Tax=Diadema antillarum TaxID=105358 RepID=UPI003A85747D
MPEGDRQKSHGPDQRSAKDDLLLVEKRIDHYGGELRNETFGISLSIPPGALVEGTSEIITLTILTEKPEDLKLRDDEMIVSYGFRCSPPGLKFLAPVRLTIPHCAVLTDPAKVETVLYLSDENGKPVNIGRRIAVVFDDGQSQESGYRRITSSGKASSFQGQS